MQHVFKDNNRLTYTILFFFLLGFLSLFQGQLIDDTYITLTYVRNLTEFSGWGMLPHLESNSATSPLNVLVLSLFALIVGPSEFLVVLVTGFLLIITFWLLAEISRKNFGVPYYGFLAGAFIALNPLLLSTLGLESILFITLLVAALYAFQFKQMWLLGATLGLLTTTRAEGGIFLLIFMLFVCSGKDVFRMVIAYVGLASPWYLFSWIFLGSIVPDTLFIKMEQESWGEWSFANGLILFLTKYPLEIFCTFLVFPLLITVFFKPVQTQPLIRLLFLFTVVHYSAYCLLGVPPYHWYYAPGVASAIMLGCFGLGYFFQSLADREGESSFSNRLPKAMCLLLSLFPLVAIIALTLQPRQANEMFIHTNWAPTEQYKEIGRDIKKLVPSSDAIRLYGEIGIVAYYCECLLLDEFSDRHHLAYFLEKARNKSGFNRRLIGMNNFFYSPKPSGINSQYILTAYNEQPPENAIKIKNWQIDSRWSDRRELALYRIRDDG